MYGGVPTTLVVITIFAYLLAFYKKQYFLAILFVLFVVHSASKTTQPVIDQSAVKQFEFDNNWCCSTFPGDNRTTICNPKKTIKHFAYVTVPVVIKSEIDGSSITFYYQERRICDGKHFDVYDSITKSFYDDFTPYCRDDQMCAIDERDTDKDVCRFDYCFIE